MLTVLCIGSMGFHSLASFFRINAYHPFVPGMVIICYNNFWLLRSGDADNFSFTLLKGILHGLTISGMAAFFIRCLIYVIKTFSKHSQLVCCLHGVGLKGDLVGWIFICLLGDALAESTCVSDSFLA